MQHISGPPRTSTAEGAIDEALRQIELQVAHQEPHTRVNTLLAHATPSPGASGQVLFAREALRFSHSLGRQVVLLVAQRELLNRVDPTRCWDLPDVERENYYRLRTALSFWREDRALVRDLLAGRQEAVEHVVLTRSPVRRWGLFVGYVSAAAAAAAHFFATYELGMALVMAAASVLANVTLLKSTARYTAQAPTERTVKADALLRGSFLHGVRSVDPAAAARAEPDIDAWLDEVELSVDPPSESAG